MATADPLPQGLTGSAGELTDDPSGPGKMTSHEKTIGHRGIDPTGETTYKKTPSSALRGAIQLGIAHTVGSLTQKPERDVLMQDFEVVESIIFPSEGTNLTPAHHYMDFRFKTYAPIAFRYFRDMYGIRPDDYMCSLCNDPLIELSSSGASGSLFYVSSDDEFIIKTVQHKEAEFLQKLLPGYFLNLNQNKRTLLPKFYGLYCIQAGGKNIRLVVMNNLLPRAIPMHLKFDLKGSTYKRQASVRERAKSSPTYKDLDFRQDLPEGLLLEPEHYNALCKTIQRDCLLLQSFKIMDYSLLVGLHRLEQGRDEVPVAAPDAPRRAPTVRALYCTAMEAIQGEATGASSDQCHDHLGGIPAFSKGERVILFIGIIDILQSYRLVKKLEHSWKALVHDGDTVSVHRPGFYADRFQKFMCSMVFKRIPRELKTSPSRRSRGGPQTLRRGNMASASVRLPPGQSNPQPPPPPDRVQPQETPQASAQSPDTVPILPSKDSDRGSVKTSPSRRSRGGPQTLRRGNMAAASVRLPPGQSNPQPPPPAQPPDRVQPQETPQASAQSPDTVPILPSKDSDRGSGMQATCPDLLLATPAQDNITNTSTSCAATTNTNTTTTTTTTINAPLAEEEIVEPPHIATGSKKAQDTATATASAHSLSVQSRAEGEPRVS